MRVKTKQGVCCIREAKPSDLPQLVAVHITSFNATYPDHEPKPGVDLREQQWRMLFAKRPGHWFCYLIQSNDKTIVGFASGHDFNDPALPYKGLLDKIHILKAYQRMGLGSLLVLQVVRRFLQQGLDSMLLFADPVNPAIHFYDGLQGERLLDPDQTFRGAFGWKNLQVLESILCRREQKMTFLSSSGQP